MIGQAMGMRGLFALLCLAAVTPAQANTGGDGVTILHPGVAVHSSVAAPAAGGIDEGPLWRLYDAGDYDGVRREIDRLRQTTPSWQPPARLLDLMADNETRGRLRAAHKAGRWREVLALAGKPDCGRIESLWAAAEAHAALGDAMTAERLYRQGATTCPDDQHRIASLQKAAAHLPAGRMPGLYGDAAAAARSKSLRRRIEAVRTGQAGGRAGACAGTAPEACLAALGAAAPTGGTLEDIKMRAWSYFRLNRPDEAALAFRQLLAKAVDPGARKEAAYGLSLSLEKTGQVAEAAALARTHGLEAGSSLEAEALGRQALDAYARQDYRKALDILEHRSTVAPGNHDLDAIKGWSLYHLNRYGEAKRIFTALDRTLPTRETAEALEIIEKTQFHSW